MSVGKKKSGFQITSVTSDYEKEALLQGEDPGKAPSNRPSGRTAEEANPVENGHHPHPLHPTKNGPSATGCPLPHLGSLSNSSSSCGSSSRFRVVKLDHGLGEPYKRGRWTCRDFYEPDLEQQQSHHHHHHPAGRQLLLDAARHPQSLDSRLEVAGLLATTPCSTSSSASSSAAFGTPGPRRGAGPGLQSLLMLPGPGTSAHQARSLGGGLPVLRPGRTLPPPPSLASLHGARVVAETPRAPAPHEEGPHEEPPQPGAVPLVRVEEQLLPRSVLPRETDERHKVLPRETRSRPSSPAPLLFREAASPHRRTSDPFGVARFNLARSVFGLGGSHDSDDESGTNSSMIAIDNKIEQAMDLVKSHLMFAVREEVEVLREQIKELSERNAALEQENSLLRSLAGAEQGGHFQAQLHESKPPSAGSA